MRLNNNQCAFFALVKAGLWEQDARLSQLGIIDFKEVERIAEEQSVVGLVSAGLEHLLDVIVPKDVLLTFVGKALQLEQRNIAMNEYLRNLIENLRKEGIYTLLLKGQGIAQCYEKPLWRASGDIDLFLSSENYNKAFNYLSLGASEIEDENPYTKHVALTVNHWEVELHGNLNSGVCRKIDKELQAIQKVVFFYGKVRSWMNVHTHIFMLKEDEDIVYVFTHILHHFYGEGIGLRQICDWCRLLWTYRDTIDKELLRRRLSNMGVETEWKAFAYFAVEYLGMPVDAVLFYSPSTKWKKKADLIAQYVLKVGNFGHNVIKHKNSHTFLSRKCITAWNMVRNSMRHFRVFPFSSFRTCIFQVTLGLKKTMSLGCNKQSLQD